MRFSTFFALSAALFSVVPVLAQSPLPACAATCFKEALMNQTTCAPTDVPCICHDQPLNLAIQGCVIQSCTLIEALSAVNTTYAMCGIPIKDRSKDLIITNAVFGACALIAIAIRMSVAIQQRMFTIDDFCALGAYFFSLPDTYGQIYAGVLGFGKDTWAVKPENIYTIMKLVYFDELSYFFCVTFTKLCFCFIYLRIFPAKGTRKLVYTGIAFSMVFPITFGIPMVFACKPVAAVWYSWDRMTPYKHCMNQTIFWLVTAGYNIITDIFIVLIPIPELVKLNLSTKKKMMLIAIFSTGLFTITVSIIRLWALAQYGHSTNPLYDNVLSGIFSPLELNVGIIAACMPSFRRFMVRFIPSWGNSASNTKNQYRGYENGTPNGRLSTGRRSKKSELTGSLFQTNILKTVDTRIEDKTSEDDEVQLMELKKNGKIESSRGSADDVSQAPPSERIYKAQHHVSVVPEDW